MSARNPFRYWQAHGHLHDIAASDELFLIVPEGIRQMKTCVQAMIFDFDGTLAHLTLDFGVMRQRAMHAARAVADRTGQTAHPLACGTSSALPADDGRPMLEWLETAHRHLAQTCPVTADDMLRSARQAIEDVEVDAAGKGALFPWTRAMLDALRKDGIATAVITRNCRKAVLAVFPDVLDYCVCLLTREDVPQVKPHPDHLLRALAHTGTAPERSLMVGDHPMDIATGKAGGTLTAGVASGSTPHGLLAAEKPDFMARDCMDLYEQLRGGTCPDIR